MIQTRKGVGGCVCGKGPASAPLPLQGTPRVSAAATAPTGRLLLSTAPGRFHQAMWTCSQASPKTSPWKEALLPLQWLNSSLVKQKFNPGSVRWCRGTFASWQDSMHACPLLLPGCLAPENFGVPSAPRAPSKYLKNKNKTDYFLLLPRLLAAAKAQLPGSNSGAHVLPAPLRNKVPRSLDPSPAAPGRPLPGLLSLTGGSGLGCAQAGAEFADSKARHRAPRSAAPRSPRTTPRLARRGAPPCRPRLPSGSEPRPGGGVADELESPEEGAQPSARVRAHRPRLPQSCAPGGPAHSHGLTDGRQG